MSWIALRMLTGDRAKFYGIVLGLTFAALLIMQQLSIFCGLMLRTAGQVADITGADLWVMDANVRYVDDVKPMIENNLYRVRGVEGVEWAVPLYKGNARAKMNSFGRVPADPKDPKVEANLGKKFEVIEQVILLGLDDASLVGAPPPERILVGVLGDLRQPDAVIVDFTRLQKLYPGENWRLQKFDRKPAALLDDPTRRAFEASYGRVPVDGAGKVSFYSLFLGREMEMNDHRAIIVGVCEATRTFQSNAVVYTTYSRSKQFVARERKPLTYILAKAEGTEAPGLSPERRAQIAGAVAQRIERQTGLGAKSSDEFQWMTIMYYMKYTGIPINFGITTILGFIIGTAIAGQTFYNFTIENLKQFGSLKAMGATNSKIVWMILLQAVVVGALGYGLGVGVATLFGVMTEGGEMAFFTPKVLLPIVAGAIFVICILSSVLSVRRVIVLEPAVVFRG